MFEYNELVTSASRFTLDALSQTQRAVLEALQERASRSLVHALQMIQMQKAILATGLFSLYDAELQRVLDCENGFKECKQILMDNGENKLSEKFEIYCLAINVLKHGDGRSYQRLLADYKSLPFRIKRPGENFFFEGDVSEISTLIEVDEDFVLNCVELVSQVSCALGRIYGWV